MVGVLILVHQHIMELLLVLLPDLLMLLQKLHRHIDDVVKIQGIVVLQLLLIFDISPGDVGGPDIAGIFSPLQHHLRGHHVVLFLADGTQDVFRREGLVVQAHILDDFLHDPL